ncbi:hypothetical protein LEMLEM_LOCUS9952, partial [Lemmus lemmus]
ATATHIQSLVLCWIPHCQSGVSDLPLAQVNCFSGYPHHGLDPFAHIIAFPPLQLDFGSSAQCFAVDPSSVLPSVAG